MPTTDDPSWLVTDHTVYACVVGSRAYGLAGPDSDVDRRGVFVTPTPLFWPLDKPPTHVAGPAAEQFSWEVERCCTLALAANPTVLECLWSPIVVSVTKAGEELLELRRCFLSRRAAATYGAYAQDQLHRWQHRIDRDGDVRWKQIMHVLRLLLAGTHLLRTGEVLVDMRDHREELLSVRRGERTVEDVTDWAHRLGQDLGAAAAASPLSAQPDRGAIDDYLIRIRRAAL